MRHAVTVLLVGLLCISLALPVYALQGLFVDGLPVPVSDHILRGAYYMPIRPLAIAIGYDVIWNERTRKITLIGDDNEVVLSESIYALFNGRVIALQRAPVIIQGIFYVPIRTTLELLGSRVDYLAASDSFFVYTDKGNAQQEIQPSSSIRGVIHRAQGRTYLTVVNTGRWSLNLVPMVIASSGRVGLVGWVSTETGKPIFALVPGREYSAELSLPAWVANEEEVDILWVDSTRFRGEAPAPSDIVMRLTVSLRPAGGTVGGR